jgi:chromosome segregation ATPase
VAERQAVEEIAAPLEAEHRRLERELAAVEGECADLRARVQRLSEQIREMDAEAEALRGETVVLRAEAGSARRQLERLGRQASTLEQDLVSQSAFGSRARASLRATRGAVLRMEFKMDSRGEGEPA